ncbi:MAG: sulfite exporter TauE/SafE family protein [Victivallaceae bacterium]|nr:sulfite exporter TauE/SafE family protein [Victivallaceae bacterium]
MDFLSEVTLLQWSILIASALLVGINKTALPGIGVLPVVLLAQFFETRLSTGLQLIMLAATDLVAVCYYRRHADWRIVGRLMPFALCGLGLGVVTLLFISSEAMKPAIGLVVLGLMALNVVRKRMSPENLPSGLVIAGICGVLLGFTTQIANAAGPVAAIYFLALRLPKDKYMGCNAWTFLLINWIKLPIFIGEGRITFEALKIDALMIPFLLLGAWAGVKLLPKMPQRIFELVIEVLIFISAVRLVVDFFI